MLNALVCLECFGRIYGCLPRMLAACVTHFIVVGELFHFAVVERFARRTSCRVAGQNHSEDAFNRLLDFDIGGVDAHVRLCDEVLICR